MSHSPTLQDVASRLARVLRLFALSGVVAWCHSSTGFSQDSPATTPSYSAIDIAPAWAGHTVGFNLLTENGQQFAAFYDANRQMTIAQRTLGSREWKLKKLPTFIEWDSHNSITLAVDRQGFLHVSGNMHNVPLIYFRSERPYDADSLQEVKAMTGENEDRVTYPRFFKDGSGQLVFSYRNGGSGSGDTFINFYDEATKKWTRRNSVALFDGEGKMNAYPSLPPVMGPDGYFHVLWVWRDSPAAETNHDLSYARSKDLEHWENATGEPLALPLTIHNSSLIVDPVPAKGGLLNGIPKIGFDQEKRVVISYFKYDESGATQLYLARFENGAWNVQQAADWIYRYDFSGRGSLTPSGISIGPVEVKNDKLTIELRHPHEKSGAFEVDPATLKLGGALAQDSTYPQQLRRTESRFPGVRVKWMADSNNAPRQTQYYLRWEALPANRDQPRPEPWPEPSMLRLVELHPAS